MVEEKILRTISEHNLIEKNQHIVLGLSGGPDSVCLFDVLLKLAKEMNLTIHAVHVNHKFRPGAAEEDQAYVENLCKEKGVRCHSFVYDCNEIAAMQKITSEEAGRNARYEAFARVAQEVVDSGVSRKMLRIGVAQNSDDQAETILFRVLRGAGTDGLAGISYSRFDEQGNQIIRPLLDVSKAEIMEYCARNHLNPRIDKTNLESVYARNKIRLELIPYLEREYNANIKDTINRMGAIAATDKDYLWQQAAKVYAKTCSNDAAPEQVCIPSDSKCAPTEQLCKLSDSKCAPTAKTCTSSDPCLAAPVRMKCSVLRTEHKAMRLRVFSMALKNIGLTEDVTYKHLEGCDSILFNDKPSASWDLPRGYVCRKIYDEIEFAQAAEAATAAPACDKRDKAEAATAAPACDKPRPAPGQNQCGAGSGVPSSSANGTQKIKLKIMSYKRFMETKGMSSSYAAFDFEALLDAKTGNAQIIAGGEPKTDEPQTLHTLINLRTRRAGDYICLNEHTTKKLQDFFVDNKVPKSMRDKVQLVAWGSEVLWVLPSGNAPDGACLQGNATGSGLNGTPDGVLVAKEDVHQLQGNAPDGVLVAKEDVHQLQGNASGRDCSQGNATDGACSQGNATGSGLYEAQDGVLVKGSKQKGRFSGKYKLCEETKNVIIVEIIG